MINREVHTSFTDALIEGEKFFFSVEEVLEALQILDKRENMQK